MGLVREGPPSFGMNLLMTVRLLTFGSSATSDRPRSSRSFGTGDKEMLSADKELSRGSA